MNFRFIEGYEGLYSVSDSGEVFSYRSNKLLSKTKTTTGYYKVELYKDGSKKSLKVHRLVAMAFIPKIEYKPFINHKDGNKLNNNVENLEWCTQKENVNHALTTGLKKFRNITEEELIAAKASGNTMKQIAKENHISYLRLIRIVDENKLPRRKYYIPKDELIKCFDDGMSNKEIALLFNCPSNLIARRRYQHRKGDY